MAFWCNHRSDGACPRSPSSSFCLVLSLATLVVTSSSTSAMMTPAGRADDFVDSVGTNTHFTYTDTNYANATAVGLILADLGVRHIRDDAYSSSHGVNEAAPTVDVNVVLDKRDAQGCLDFASLALAVNASANISRLASMEGANEIDLLMFSQCNAMAGVWFVFDQVWQEALYSLIRGGAAGQNASQVTLVAPSLGWGTAPGHPRPLCAIGDSNLTCNVANMHSYPGGHQPLTQLLNNINDNAKVVGGEGKPVWATETGYHTATRYNGTAQWGVDEGTHGKYIPRLLLLYYSVGVQRTFIYELLDQWLDTNLTNPEAHFGLVRFNYTYKPGASALKALLSLLAEPNAPSFTPQPQDITITDPSFTVNSTLLAKSDGTYFLAMWREVESYDVEHQVPLYPPAVNVTVTFGGGGVFTRADVFLPSTSGTTPVQVIDPLPASVVFSVPDEVLLLRLIPQLRR